MKILLLEDNARLNATIVKRLEAKAYSVDSFIDVGLFFNWTDPIRNL